MVAATAPAASMPSPSLLSTAVHLIRTPPPATDAVSAVADDEHPTCAGRRSATTATWPLLRTPSPPLDEMLE